MAIGIEDGLSIAVSWGRFQEHCERVLDLIEAFKVNGNPQAVFTAIEKDLRAKMAVPIEPALSETRRRRGRRCR